MALLVGYLLQVFMTSNFTLVQIISPDYIRGRVLSIRMVAVGIGPGRHGDARGGRRDVGRGLGCGGDGPDLDGAAARHSAGVLVGAARGT